MLTYQNYQLDSFQQEAIAAIDRNHSVLVSAPTGTGKTLIADYLVEKALQDDTKIIYTAPIKALSNQKYRDFAQRFGSEAVGIMTGDIVINPRASLLIMTTEVFRNQVITGDPALADIQYVIFDEIHWLNDEARGTVWEESIILAPPHMRLLGLSATIANASELKDWMSNIRRQEIILIEEPNRIIPLEYKYFTKQTGFCTYLRLKTYYDNATKNLTTQDLRETPTLFDPTTHIDLIKAIEHTHFPCLYFAFSRRQCSEKATELAAIRNYLSKPQRRDIHAQFIEQFGPEPRWSPSTRQLYSTCAKGIAYHHAGMLPSQKLLVETLFQTRIISVLYCTETFSVGINYPVRTVCFDSLRKYDGHSFRTLKNHEFFQMSGRAGRRGIDKKGYSFAIPDLNYCWKNPIPRFHIHHLEPLTSQFRLTYNTVLNLLATLTPEQIKTYFQKSFASHAYTRLQAETQEQADTLTRQLEHIYHTACDKISTLSCPHEYAPQAKELQRLQHALNRLDKRSRGKAYGHRLRRKIRHQKALLPDPPGPCTKQDYSVCRELNKRRLCILNAQEELKQRLDIPGSETFYTQFLVKVEHLKQLGYIEELIKHEAANREPTHSGLPTDDPGILKSSSLEPPGRGTIQLAARGSLARQIYVEELLVTELIFSGLLDKLDNPALCALISCIDYETRKNDYFSRPPHSLLPWEPIRDITIFLQSICGPDAVQFDSRVAVVAHAWSQGSTLAQVQKLCNLDEGDIISLFRRTIDLLRQMREALPPSDLRSRLTECMKALDRDEAAVIDT